MGWAKVDELLPHHVKILAAGPQGPAVLGLYVASLCYAQRHFSDGLIPAQALPSVLPGCPHPDPDLIAALVQLGLWEHHDDGWRIHNYLEHNASAASRREAEAVEAQRKRELRRQAASVRKDARKRPAGRSNPSENVQTAVPGRPKTSVSSSEVAPISSEERNSPPTSPQKLPDGFSRNRDGPDGPDGPDEPELPDPEARRRVDPSVESRYLEAVRRRREELDRGE